MTTGKTPSSTSVHSIVMRPKWLRAIAKAASSIRFTADNWNWVTEPARQESLEIADTLTEIENAAINGHAERYDEMRSHLISIAASLARFQHVELSEMEQQDLPLFGDYARRLKKIADSL